MFPTCANFFLSRPELDHPRKGLIRVQNMDDNHCFRLLVIRYLNPLDKNRAKSKQMIEFVKQFDLI